MCLLLHRFHTESKFGQLFSEVPRVPFPRVRSTLHAPSSPWSTLRAGSTPYVSRNPVAFLFPGLQTLFLLWNTLYNSENVFEVRQNFYPRTFHTSFWSPDGSFCPISELSCSIFGHGARFPIAPTIIYLLWAWNIIYFSWKKVKEQGRSLTRSCRINISWLTFPGLILGIIFVSQ